MSEVTTETQSKPSYSNWKRFKNVATYVATYHGIAALALVTPWAAAETRAAHWCG